MDELNDHELARDTSQPPCHYEFHTGRQPTPLDETGCLPRFCRYERNDRLGQVHFKE